MYAPTYAIFKLKSPCFITCQVSTPLQFGGLKISCIEFCHILHHIIISCSLSTMMGHRNWHWQWNRQIMRVVLNEMAGENGNQIECDPMIFMCSHEVIRAPLSLSVERNLQRSSECRTGHTAVWSLGKDIISQNQNRPANFPFNHFRLKVTTQTEY